MAKQQQRIDILPQNLEYLQELHKYGIVVRDLHSGQWVEGMLVDLSYSWTVPHILGQGDRTRPDWTFASYAAQDLFMFQRIIDLENERVDFFAGHLNRQGVFGPFRKSSLVAYPSSDSVLEDPKLRIPPTFRREGLRPLPHRLIQSLREAEEDDDDEEDEELPLLLYSEQYDPDSEELPKGWAVWTFGPRWDPSQFLSGKQRRQESGPFDVLKDYINARAVARRSRRSKMKSKSKAAAVGEKPRAKARTKVDFKDKVTKRGNKRAKVV